jgi:transposase
MSLTASQKAQCVEWFISSGKSVVAFQRIYRKHFGRNAHAPDKKRIKEWYEKFKQGDGLKRKQKKGNKVRIFGSNFYHLSAFPLFSSIQWVCTDETVKEVIQVFMLNHHSSIRKVANMDGMPSIGTIHAILQEAKFHPYVLQLRQLLRQQDQERRVQHAHAQLVLIEQNADFLNHLCFSDEAHFHVHGAVNKHNFRYWSDTNPHWCRGEPLHSPRVTVWAAIGHQGVVGPFFFDGNVNGANYLLMLQQQFLPVVENWVGFPSLVFMQDGAPPHWSVTVRNFLSDTFPNRWMGRGSPNLPWPPYSPDLTPCDFFLWGWIKSRVYTTPIATLAELRERIEKAFDDLSMDLINRAIKSYERRLQHCIAVDGKSVEER